MKLWRTNERANDNDGWLDRMQNDEQQNVIIISNRYIRYNLCYVMCKNLRPKKKFFLVFVRTLQNMFVKSESKIEDARGLGYG